MLVILVNFAISGYNLYLKWFDDAFKHKNLTSFSLTSSTFKRFLKYTSAELKQALDMYKKRPPPRYSQ